MSSEAALQYRQGLLARTDDEIEEEIIIDLSDESDESYTSSSEEEAFESEEEQDFAEDGYEKDQRNRSRARGRGRGNRRDISLSSSRSGSLSPLPANHTEDPRTASSSQQQQQKTKNLWNEKSQSGHVNWSDEVDDNNQKAYLIHSHGSSNRDGAIGKKATSSRKAVEKSSFSRRSDHHSSASVDDKWTHDLFEQHELSDGDRGAEKSRRSKPARAKKTPAKKTNVTKELRLKKQVAPTFARNVPSSTTAPSASSVADSDAAPNWAAAVASDSSMQVDASEQTPLLAEKVSAAPSESSTFNGVASTADPVDFGENSLPVPSSETVESEAQVPEKVLANLSIDSPATEPKPAEVSAAEPVEVSVAEPVEALSTQVAILDSATTVVGAKPTDPAASLNAPGSGRPRRVISQASKNQLMASFNRPGGILFRSALTAAGASSPVPRTSSPAANPVSSTSSTASPVPASEKSVTEKPLAPSSSEPVSAPLPPPLASSAIEKTNAVIKDQREQQQRMMPPPPRQKERDLRESLPPKEFTLQKAPKETNNANREYHRDREPRLGSKPSSRSAATSATTTKDSHSRERLTPSSRENPRVDYSIRRSSTQDSRESLNSRASANSREQQHQYSSPVQERQHNEKERFVVEKKNSSKSSKKASSENNRRGQKSEYPQQSAPDPVQHRHQQQHQLPGKDLEPKVIATSTGWALVTPTVVPKPAEPVKDNSRPKRLDRNNDHRNNNEYGALPKSNNINSNLSGSGKSYKSKRQQQQQGVGSIGAPLSGSDPNPAALPYTPAVQPMINVQPMMTQSGHMVLLTEDGLCVPATPGMFQYQNWYDQSLQQQPPPPPAAVAANQTYPTYYTDNYYASPSETKQK